MSRTLIALAFLVATLLGLAPSAWGNGILLTGAGGTQPRHARGGLVRMTTHRVKAKITDQIAQVTVEQVFRSASRQQLEGTYIFPLPEGAVVSDFAMTMAGKMVKGEVVEAKKARGIYEGIVRRRRDPGLLEYLGRGLFRARVFPIMPGEDLTIRLSFQQVLRDDAGTMEFRYPLATQRMNAAPVDVVLLKVDVESSADLKALYSPSHRIALERDGERRAHLTFEGSGRQDRDFLLYLGRDRGAVGFSLLSHKQVAKDGTFMAVLAPRNEVDDAERSGRDVIFVLDTSGSMAGEKIDQARKALAYGVNTLHPKDRFTIVSFSSGSRPWRRSLVEYTKEARDAALKWIQGLKASGGTDIEGALGDALGITQDGRRAMIVFLTDGKPTVGETSSAALVAQLKRTNKRKARIFTFGVGYDLDVKLLDKIAEASRGARDYVAPEEDIEVVTGRFFRKVSRPVLTDVELVLGDDVYDVYPKTIDDLFSGSQVVLFGRYREGGAREIVLQGNLDGQPMAYVYATKFKEGAGLEYLERLWANRKVAYLLDNIRLHGELKELRDEVIRLATQHAIVTPYTSGLVVEESELSRRRVAQNGAIGSAGGRGGRRLAGGARAGGDPVIRDEAIEDHVETDNDLPYAEGFGGSEGASDAPFEGPANNGTIGVGGGGGGAFRGRGGSRDVGTGGGGRKKFDDAVDDALRWLAAHQSPNGGWEAAGFDRWCDGRLISDAGQGRADTGSRWADPSVSGLALSAFLGAGYTNRGRHPFAKVVSRGLRYLKNIQDPEGCFGPRSSRHYLYNHATASLAMVEAYGMTGSPILRGAAQRCLDFILLARNPHAAWGHGIKPGSNDLRLTAWMLSVLESARLINSAATRGGRPAPLMLDPAAYTGVRRWLDRVMDPTYEIPSAAAFEPPPSAPAHASVAEHGVNERAALGTWIRILLGGDPRKDGRIRRGALSLIEGAGDLEALPAETVYFGTLVAHDVGARMWKQWKAGLDRAAAAQHRGGDYCHRKGSWTPRGHMGRTWGPVGATALGAMNLEVFYRYDRAAARLRQRPAAARTPAQRRAAQPLTEKERAEESVALERRKTASTPGNLSGGRIGMTRMLAGKSFVLRSTGRWEDIAWDGKKPTTRVTAWSDDYFALVRIDEQVARYLTLGERVVFCLGETVYEITPPK